MRRLLLIFLSLTTLFNLGLSSVYADEDYLIPNNALFYYSKNYLLMDLDDGRVLFERNGYEKVHPASITKVATLISALEIMESKGISSSDTFTFTQEVFNGMASNASIAGFLLGETVTIEDLLYGIIMPSGADATRAISLHLTGSVEGLSENMNQLATKLGLKDTYFVNTSGLDDPKHLSTPYELALLVQYAMKNEAFVSYYTTVHYTTSPTRQHPQGIDFTNRSLQYGKQMSEDLFTGAKSGHTELAERALSSVSMYEGTNLVFISTNAPQEEVQNTNITDAVQTYRYMYRNYIKATLLEKQDSVLTIPLKKGKEDIIIDVKEELRDYIPKDTDMSTIQVKHTSLLESPQAPIKKGTALAKTEVFIEDKLVYSLTHNAEKDYEVSLFHKTIDILTSIIKWLLIILSTLFVVGFTIRTYNIQQAKKKRRLRNMKKKKTIN